MPRKEKVYTSNCHRNVRSKETIYRQKTIFDAIFTLITKRKQHCKPSQRSINSNMAYREKEIERLYYSIGEVAEMLQVTASQIRYWETEFSLLKPRKDRKGNRLFTKEDIQTIKLIHHLLREKGLTIEGAKAHLKTSTVLTKKNFKVIDELKEVKKFLEELRDQL